METEKELATLPGGFLQYERDFFMLKADLANKMPLGISK